MPVYEYQCEACGSRTQRLQKVGDDSTGEVCPVCRRGALRKVFSPFGMWPGGGGSCGENINRRFG